MKVINMLKVVLGTHLTAHRLISSAPLSSAVKQAMAFKRVVVVGGGAAGYFSAIECAKLLAESQKETRNIRYEVVILEAGQKPLTKVLISGGGRCNVMHNPMKGPTEIAKGYPRGGKELLGPLSAKFGPWETFDWFSSRGVDLKTEKDGRVFPTTDRSSSITEILETAARKYSVDIKCGARVTSIKSIPINPPSIAALPPLPLSTPLAIPLAIPLPTSTPVDTTIVSTPVSVTPSKKSKSPPKDITPPEPCQFHITYVTSTSAVFDTMKNSKVGDKKGVEDGDEEDERRPKEEKTLICDKVIFATGGSRVGYDMLKGLGHSLVAPLPSLFSFKIPEKPLHELAGVSVQYSTVRLIIPKEFSKGPDKHLARPQSMPLLTQKGALLVTHQGLSGPAALRLSAFGAKIMAAMAYKFDVEVCWIPDVTAEDLFTHLWREKDKHPTRMMSKGFPHVPESILLEPDADFVYTEQETYNYEQEKIENSGNNGDYDDDSQEKETNNDSAVRGVLTKRLWNYILSRSAIPPETKWEKASKVDITKIVQELLTGKYSVTGRGMYRDEFVTCGGVPLKEVSFESMESKLVPGLHLAGEVLDIDGITGGYNFQSAWTAGWLAGHSAATSLISK